MMRSIALVAVMVCLVCCFVEQFCHADENEWMKIHSIETGGKSSVIFFYNKKDKNWYVSGGRPGGDYQHSKVHYGTEYFNLKEKKWVNAYPEGSPYKNLEGISDAPIPKRLKGRHVLGEDPAGYLRIMTFKTEYLADSTCHYQWAFSEEDQKCYAYLSSKTIAYDVKKKSWIDLKAKGFEKTKIYPKWSQTYVQDFPMYWGSLCLDSINHEILSCGGSSAQTGGTPGSWIFKIKENKWVKLEYLNDVKSLQSKGSELYIDARKCLGIFKNRFYHSETRKEAQLDLTKHVTHFLKSLENGVSAISTTKSKCLNKVAIKEAVRRYANAIDLLKRVTGSNKESCVLLKKVSDWVWLGNRALDLEPFGRAHSQMVFDKKNKKILLFGGSYLDSCGSDTWLYDIKTKSWTQKFPAISPSPRAGHAMCYLPKSQKIMMMGGYTMKGWFAAVPQVETWTYDIEKNSWHLLNSVSYPNGKVSHVAPLGRYKGGVYVGGTSPWVMASNEKDEVLAISTGETGRKTWLFQANPLKHDKAGTKNLGVEQGALKFSKPPENYEIKAKVNAKSNMVAFLKNLKDNEWSALPTPPKGPSWRAWNSMTYDSLRHQIILWGGGHVTYMGTEVSHFSMETLNWSASWNPDLPTAPGVGFAIYASVSFKDNPQVPVHAYQAYAFDEPSGNMLYLNRLYNVQSRTWDPTVIKGLKHKGVMKTLLEPTPSGVVSASVNGFYQYKAKENSWRKLPWKGPVYGGAWCDGDSLCYDSKRNVIWAGRKNSITKYDMKTGVAENFSVTKPKSIGRFPLWREQVYVPELDKILLMRLFKGPDGKPQNLIWDPKTKKYYWVKIPYFEKGKVKIFREDSLTWSTALHYDAKYKLVILAQQGTPYVLKLNAKTLKLVEAK